MTREKTPERTMKWLGLAAGMTAGLALAMTSTSALAWSYKEAAAPYKGTTVRVLDETTPLQETFAPLVAQFNAETGINVVYELLNHFEVINKGQADMLSGRGYYDAVMNHPFQLGLLLDADVLRPLDDMLANSKLTNPDLDLGDMIEPSYSSLTKFGGKTYGFLNWNYNSVYWARGDLLGDPGEQKAFKAKYGYDLKPAETLQKMRDIAEFFTRKAGEKLAGKTLDSDFYGIVMEGSKGGTTYQHVWFSFVRNFGGRFFDDSGRPMVESAETVAGLTAWADLWQFAPPGMAEYSLIDVPTVMGNGIAAQTIAWSDFVLGVDKPGASDLAGKFVYAPIPRNGDSDGPYFSAATPSGMNISVHSKNPEATYLFIQWMTEKSTQKALLAAGKGGVPIRKSSWSDPSLTNSKLADLFVAMRASMKGGYAEPKFPRLLEMGDAMNGIIQQIGLKSLTPAEGAKKLQAALLAICEKCLLEK